jgi:hypothetical protein
MLSERPISPRPSTTAGWTRAGCADQPPLIDSGLDDAARWDRGKGPTGCRRGTPETHVVESTTKDGTQGVTDVFSRTMPRRFRVDSQGEQGSRPSGVKMIEYLAFEGPANTLFVLEDETFRVLTDEGQEVVVPLGELIELFVKISLHHAQVFARVREAKRLAALMREPH